jgi:hypothetical protein
LWRLGLSVAAGNTWPWQLDSPGFLGLITQGQGNGFLKTV